MLSILNFALLLLLLIAGLYIAARLVDIKELKRKNSKLIDDVYDLRVKRNHDKKHYAAQTRRNVQLRNRLKCYEGIVPPLDFAPGCTTCIRGGIECTCSPEHDDVIPKKHLNADKYRGDKHAD